jgi:hypothetical protein
MHRICAHLDRDTDWDYAQYFTGAGIEYGLVCMRCCREPEAIETNLREVTPERFAQIEEIGYWERDRGGILGRPQILERPTGLTFRHEETRLAHALPGEIADLRPIPASSRSEWLALSPDGVLHRFDLGTGSAGRPINAFDPGPMLEPEWRLHVSAVGDMAAVVEAAGRYGVVLDLEAGRPTMRLDRGEYRFEHSDFPAAFFEVDGALRLVHGTDWNRLDVSDPRTGRLLTGRSLGPPREGERLPEHYLDYFHGGLAASPDGEWIADNGWVWSPVGAVTAWDLRRWVEENPWESEDGPTRRALCWRHYFWEGPICWIDGRTLAVWGYGNDEENLIPAALLFDVESGDRLRWFAGPAGSMAFDRHLFSWSKEAGTSVWDVGTGERLLHDPSFCPTAYHPGASEFLTVLPNGGFRRTRLVGARDIPSEDNGRPRIP